MTDKYELTNNTKKTLKTFGHTLHQIKALKDFGDVKKGDLGGWIESQGNLSQTGLAWVYDNASVYDHAQVFGDAQVRDNARVFDHAQVLGQAKVYDYACVYGYAWVNYAHIIDYARVRGNARVYGDAYVRDDAEVYGNAQVFDNAQIYGKTQVCDNAHIFESGQVYGNAKVFGSAYVYNKAKVYGNAWVHGIINICENDKIYSDDSYLVFRNTWSSGRDFVYVLSNQRWHVGCFNGTGEELIKRAYSNSELSGKMYELYVHIAKQVVKTQQQLEEGK